MATATIELTGDRVEPPDVVAVARHGVPARLSEEARAAMAESAAVVERLAASEEPVYGVSTGFGSLAATWIPPERREELQRALIRSHAAGMGPPVEREVVRAMMFLRARSLAMGRSGARPVVADTMLALLAAGLDPVVPEHGSLGASGDLAPLAHCGLALIGEGELWTGSGERAPAADALADASIEPLTLTSKEGLALINGTDGILGMLVLALYDSGRLLRLADVTAAMSTEALLGTDRAFAADLIAMRPQPGQASSAANLIRLLAGSEIVASHRWDDPRVQDAYSVRCAPQVNGAARDTRSHAERVALAELRSAIDNPVVLPDGRVESCGNFHGAPVAMACDFLAIAAADVGAIAERRTDRLLDQTRSYGLPPFLTEDAGVNSGLMLAHYTQAAMVAENRRLAVPAAHRLAAHERDAGGPRLDGLGRGAQAAHRDRQPDAHPRGRADLRRAGDRPARAAAAGSGHGGGARRAADGRPWPRRRPLARAGAGGGRGAGRVGRACSRRSSGRSASSNERAQRASGARRRPVLPRLAAGGRAADADEQPRPRRGRAPRRPGGLRRHRARGALVGGVRRDRGHAAHAGRRRDAARPVGQAGRRVPHPRMGAARADRELQPRARVGDLGGVPPARGSSG